MELDRRWQPNMEKEIQGPLRKKSPTPLLGTFPSPLVTMVNNGGRNWIGTRLCMRKSLIEP